MKKLLLTTALLAGFYMANAQQYITRTGKVSFFSTTPAENIEAFNNETASVLDAKTGEVVFQVPIKSFKFDKALMQEHFNENYMESDKFPKAEFKGKIVNLSDVDFGKDGTYNVTTKGALTIHGVTRQVSIPGTITVKGGTVTTNSKFNVRLTDHKIKGHAKVAESIEVTVNTILNKK